MLNVLKKNFIQKVPGYSAHEGGKGANSMHRPSFPFRKYSF
jgi:hypothetical protein